jgi:hypothetical protein
VRHAVAISHQVKALEAELGIKLFNRQRQRLVITLFTNTLVARKRCRNAHCGKHEWHRFQQFGATKILQCSCKDLHDFCSLAGWDERNLPPNDTYLIGGSVRHQNDHVTLQR